VAGSPKSTSAVVQRARSAAHACRQGIAQSASGIPTSSRGCSSIPSTSTSTSITTGSSSCQEAAGLIDNLMEVSHKLGAMKSAKVCSMPALVQVAKSWLAWINRDYSLKLATKLNSAASSSSISSPSLPGAGAAAISASTPIEYLNNEAAMEAHLGRDVSVEALAQQALPLVVLPGEFKALRFLRLLPDETVWADVCAFNRIKMRYKNKRRSFM